MHAMIKRSIVAVAVVLAMSGLTQANARNAKDDGCSNSTLRGLYVFSATGFNRWGASKGRRWGVEVRDDGSLGGEDENEEWWCGSSERDRGVGG